jgi:hypothetical protein
MKKILAFVLTVALLCSFSTVAFAADPPKPPAPTEGTPAKGSVGSAEGYLMYALASSYTIHVTLYRNSITEASSAYLRLTGVTETDNVGDRLELNFTLQQWNGTAWVTYSTSNNYELQTDYETETIYRAVAHGYYYRVKTVHRGYLDSSSDEQTLYSSYIYVS